MTRRQCVHLCIYHLTRRLTSILRAGDLQVAQLHTIDTTIYTLGDILRRPPVSRRARLCPVAGSRRAGLAHGSSHVKSRADGAARLTFEISRCCAVAPDGWVLRCSRVVDSVCVVRDNTIWSSRSSSGIPSPCPVSNTIYHHIVELALIPFSLYTIIDYRVLMSCIFATINHHPYRVLLCSNMSLFISYSFSNTIVGGAGVGGAA